MPTLAKLNVRRKQNLNKKFNSKIQSEQGADEDENRTRDRRRRGTENPLEPVALPGLCGVLDHVGDVALLLNAHEQVRHRTWKVDKVQMLEQSQGVEVLGGWDCLQSS